MMDGFYACPMVSCLLDSTHVILPSAWISSPPLRPDTTFLTQVQEHPLSEAFPKVLSQNCILLLSDSSQQAIWGLCFTLTLFSTLL
jgi:hypothetical protein